MDLEMVIKTEYAEFKFKTKDIEGIFCTDVITSIAKITKRIKISLGVDDVVVTKVIFKKGKK